MSSDKVVPITGKHRTFKSMATQAINTPEAKRGCVIWFEEDGTMHFGQFGILTADIGMAQMYIQMLAVEMMQDG